MGDTKLLEQHAFWTALGAAITGIGMIIVGWIKARKETDLGMTKEQRLMLEQVWAQVQLQSGTIDKLHSELTIQREFYEAKIDELRIGYRKEISEQEASCQQQLSWLRGELVRVQEIMRSRNVD